MKFTKIPMYGGREKGGFDFWISGIYKIVSYGPGEYYAHFMPEHFLNWGNNVEKPPQPQGYWTTLKDAKAACERHQAAYAPSKKIVKRAKELQARWMQLGQLFEAA